MKSIVRILNLTIVKEYYRQNAVFIFAVLMLSFGFMRWEEHKPIIKNALNNPSLLGLIFLVWALHTVKVILFTLRMLESKNNEFLYHIRLFSPIKRFLAFGQMQFSLIQLTFLYGVLMIFVGFTEKRFIEIFAIIVFNLLLILTGIFVCEYRLARPNAISVTTKPIQNFLGRFRTPPYLFFIRYLFSKQPVLLLITKLFTCFILIGICNLYTTDTYDERLLAIAGLFVAAGHTVFCQQFLEFENKYLTFTRNLPIPQHQRLISYFIAYFLLLIPELLVLIRNLPDGVSYIFVLQLILFTLSMIFLNHHAQYINGVSNDTFMQRIFFAGILFLLLIMFKIPVILMAIVNFLLAIFVFQKKYFESTPNTPKP